jgi:hypothetical protein
LLPGGDVLVGRRPVGPRVRRDAWLRGGGIGKIFHFGRLPVNTQIGGYYNVARPEFGANWTIRAQIQFMFPK